MSNFPFQLDDDSTLPRVDDNITDIGADAINALRSSTFAIEGNIGTNAQGSTGSIAEFLSTSHNPDGSIKPSALTGLGLVTLPITNAEISQTAGIQESKLQLTYSTSSLYSLILSIQNSIDVFNGFLTLVGIKVDPHIDGTNYNHFLSQIRVDQNISYVKTNPISTQSSGSNVINRDTTNSATLVEDISNDLLVHEKLDGSANVEPISGGTIPPENFSHVGSGIYVNPTNFSTIPQSNDNVQSIIEYFDNSSLLLLGSRTQNLYSNGISRTARASSLINDGYGAPIVPPTPIVAYLLNNPPGPTSSAPVDDIDHGDDIILFSPTSAQLSSFNFDAQFAQVNAGDIITVNYGTGISLQFVIDSTKTHIVGNNRTYAVRINGKNPASNSNGIARIDKSTFNRNKYGVLATTRAINFTGDYESLIIGQPRAAVALGFGFNASMFDATHYNLYLSLLPTGDISSLISLPPVDVTGNKGGTPGNYTIDDIIDATNQAFRQPGFNYRFIAFQYNGQFGIMLAEPYNNASFSIISGIVDGYGNYTNTSLSSYPNNIVDNFNNIDPTGFGINAAAVASPPPAVAYASLNAAIFAPTLLFYPLKRNYFYTDGVEKDRVKSDPVTLNNILDEFGDGYWPATILPAPATRVLPTRVEVVYQVDLDLSQSGLKNGKTIVIQPAFPITDSRYNSRDYGRFTIKDVSFNNCNTPAAYTNITVYDGVHGFGTSPTVTSTNIPVNIYFSDDSASFDAENVFDSSISGPYKRFFEIYIDSNGHTSTHERARFLTTGNDITNINMYSVSPKLRGYTVNNDKEIRLLISDYNQTTGIYEGFLEKWNPATMTASNFGPVTHGKKGEIVRFYDETTIDYIDFIFDIAANVNSFTNKTLDIQLFSTLELDENLMLTATCQVDDTVKQISYLKDQRQFGNVSEEQFSTSALNYIAAPERLLSENGIVNGLGIENSFNNQMIFAGGTALVNGKIITINDSVVYIPLLSEVLYPSFSTSIDTITWFVCINNKGEFELIASTDYSPTQLAIYGSLDQNRIFYVKNPISGSIYPVRGTYFANLITNFVDVVPIYAVTITISGTSFSTINYRDVRRFVNSGYGGLSANFVLSQEGQFRDLNAIDAYISQLINNISFTNTQNNPKGTTVDVKGSFSLMLSSSNLNYSEMVTYQGDNSTILMSEGINLTNNVKFTNTTLNFIPFNVPNPDVIFGNNLQFINCTIISPNITSIGNNVLFKNCVITFPSNTITIGTNVSFIDCIINISTGTGLTISSDTTITGCTINYTYDATSDSSFTAANLSNPLKACLFANITDAGFTNVNINNNTFMCPNQNRFPFISFIFADSNAYAENISINYNIINTTAASDDKSAVIAVVAPSVPFITANGARWINSTINNNICNKDQMIVISSPVVGGAALVDAISCINSSISYNICGSICFITKTDTPTLVNTTFESSKENILYISNNTCRYIFSGTASGGLFTTTSPSTVIAASTFPSGAAYSGSIAITNNTAFAAFVAWRVPASSGIGHISSLKIVNNQFFAYDVNFLTPYFNGVAQSGVSAIGVERITG